MISLFLFNFLKFKMKASPFLSIILLIIHSICFAETITESIEIKLPNLVGINDRIVAQIIERLKKDISPECLKKSAMKFPDNGFSNRLLLYGISGNGKRSLARDIAIASNCQLIAINSRLIMDNKTGRSVENIKSLFNQAESLVESSGRPVVIAIDEIDIIANNCQCTCRKEYKAALKALWLKLDELKNDPRFFIICITNGNFELESAFVGRFYGRIIQIKNPDSLMREKILRYYAKKYKLILNNGLLSKLIHDNNSGKMNIRSLENFIKDASDLQEKNGKVLTDSELLNLLKKIKNCNVCNNQPEDEYSVLYRNLFPYQYKKIMAYKAVYAYLFGS